jgi:hypothetical protein
LDLNTSEQFSPRSPRRHRNTTHHRDHKAKQITVNGRARTTVRRLALVSSLVALAFGLDLAGTSTDTSEVVTGQMAPLPVTGMVPAALRVMAFPVLGPVVYRDDWGDCRDGCRRLHQGQDIMGERMQPLIATVDGTVSRLLYERGRSGNGIEITDDDGWRYVYYHVNNDPLVEPGRPLTPSEVALAAQWRWPSTIVEGTRVNAGQVIGWMGDSGNAEQSVVHLHFEIRSPDGSAVNPYTSLRAAEYIGRCRSAWPTASLGESLSTFTFPTRTGAGSFTVRVDGAVSVTGDAKWIGDQRRPIESCLTGVPVVAARAIPTAAPSAPTLLPEFPQDVVVPQTAVASTTRPVATGPVSPVTAIPATTSAPTTAAPGIASVPTGEFQEPTVEAG